MKDVTKPTKLTAKFDAFIFKAVKISLAILLAVWLSSGWLDINKIWLVNITILTAFVCFVMMLSKEVVTGKTYANKAKKRRKRIFPFWYPQKNKPESPNN